MQSKNERANIKSEARCSTAFFAERRRHASRVERHLIGQLARGGELSDIRANCRVQAKGEWAGAQWRVCSRAPNLQQQAFQVTSDDTSRRARESSSRHRAGRADWRRISSTSKRTAKAACPLDYLRRRASTFVVSSDCRRHRICSPPPPPPSSFLRCSRWSAAPMFATTTAAHRAMTTLTRIITAALIPAIGEPRSATQSPSPRTRDFSGYHGGGGGGYSSPYSSSHYYSGYNSPYRLVVEAE